jgi:hypothetical protein
LGCGSLQIIVDLFSSVCAMRSDSLDDFLFGSDGWSFPPLLVGGNHKGEILKTAAEPLEYLFHVETHCSDAVENVENVENVEIVSFKWKRNDAFTEQEEARRYASATGCLHQLFSVACPNYISKDVELPETLSDAVEWMQNQLRSE